MTTGVFIGCVVVAFVALCAGLFLGLWVAFSAMDGDDDGGMDL